MIRIIMFRKDGSGEWIEGVMHAFVDSNAVVETKATGELNLVPVRPENLKFKILMDGWIEVQREAQRQAQSRAVTAGSTPPDYRR
jgi:hypothetical protein